MSWRIFTLEEDGIEGESTSLSSEGEAVLFACDVLQSGVRVLRIEGPGGVGLTEREIIERCGPVGKFAVTDPSA